MTDQEQPLPATAPRGEVEKTQDHIRAVVGSVEHAGTRRDLARRLEERLAFLQAELRADQALSTA